LNTWYRERELRWTVGHCGVSVVLSCDRFLNTGYAPLLGQLVDEGAIRTAVIDGAAVPGTIPWSEMIAAGTGTDRAAELVARRAAVDPESVAFILYTSGS